MENERSLTLTPDRIAALRKGDRVRYLDKIYEILENRENDVLALDGSIRRVTIYHSTLLREGTLV